MSRNIIATDKDGNVVMEMTNEGLFIRGGELKTPSVDSVDEFTSFLRNINYRIEQLENEVAELKRDRAIENDALTPKLKELLNKSITVQSQINMNKYKWDTVTKVKDDVEQLTSDLIKALKNKGTI